MGIGFRELLIILAIALLIFGAKKLRTSARISVPPSRASSKP